MVTFLITIIVTGLVGTISCYIKDKQISNELSLVAAGLLGMWILFGICHVCFEPEVIPAIEVYRGHTTMDITYRDSVPIDSVVVYKI